MTTTPQETDGRYSYSFRDVPAGTATLTAMVPMSNSLRTAVPVTLELEEGQTVRHDIEFPSGGTVSGNIRGLLSENDDCRVVVLRGLDPVPTLNETVIEQLLRERALGAAEMNPENGSYTIENVEPGAHTVLAVSVPRGGDLADTPFVTVQVEVRENQESRVDLQLP